MNYGKTQSNCSPLAAMQRRNVFWATFIFSERRRFVADTTTPIWANKDKAEGMAWYGRAGAQGDLFADKVNTNHVWTDGERVELGFWILRNCPTLC
jgi:hypothetical protein